MAAKITDFKQYIKDNTIIDSNGCWIWQKGIGAGGYGAAASNRDYSTEGAHRVTYRAFSGPIPKGLLVLHSCDIPLCCNPAHLRVGTNQDNADDMLNRGRHTCNIKKHSESMFKNYGWVVTPKGKFKTQALAAIAVQLTRAAIAYRIKSPNYPTYYRERNDENKNTENI